MNKKEKTLLREKCKIIRNSIDTESVSARICEIVKNWNVFASAKNILLYYPVGTELSLLDLLKVSSKNFYFPCVIGDEIYAAKYIPSEPFITGKYGIMEPAGERICDCSFLDLIFVPALAVDYSGNRLGYGKGYYDRFLSGYPSVVTAAAVFNELCFEKIPAENHDVKIKYIITENKFYDVR